MMIDSTSMTSPSVNPVAEMNVTKRQHEEYDCYYDKDQILQASTSQCDLRPAINGTYYSELDQDVDVDHRLVSAKVGKPDGAALAGTGRCRGSENFLQRRISVVASKVFGISVVGIGHAPRARRSNSAATRPIRHIGMAIVILPAKSNPLLGHVI